MTNSEIPSVILIKGFSSTLKSETAPFLLQELASHNLRTAYIDNGMHFRAYTYGVLEHGGLNGHCPTFEEVDISHEWENREGYYGNGFKHSGERLDTAWLTGYQISSKVSEIASRKQVQDIVKVQIHEEVTELNPDIAVVVGRSSHLLDIPPCMTLFFSSPQNERVKRRQQDFGASGTAYSFEEVRKLLKKRDRLDQSREEDPLKLDPTDMIVRFSDMDPVELAKKVSQVVYQYLKDPSKLPGRRIRI